MLSYRTRLRRLAALSTAFLWLASSGSPLLAGPQAAAASAEDAGAIRGVIFKPDETSRLAGVVVTAINVKTGRRYGSNHTGDNGAYEIAALPAGTYDLAIESGEHLYVTDALIDLAEGQRLYLSFSLQPKGAGSPSSEPGKASITFTDPGAVTPVAEPAGKPKKKKGFWKSAGGIAVITILVAGVVGAGISAQRD